MLREYTVFNVSQCEGLPDEIMNGEYVAPRNQDQRESLADRFIASSAPTFARELAFPATCRRKTSFRCRPLRPSSRGHLLHNAFHELTHWTGAKHRLDRDFSGRFGTQAYAAEELVAELGAAFLNAEFGFDYVDAMRPIWQAGLNC
jgi:antirestriction protein ArdC